MNNKKIFLGTILFFIVVFIFFGLNLKNDNAKEEMDIDDTVSINNLDKINFLRQYMKSFETINEYTKSKEFIKR